MNNLVEAGETGLNTRISRRDLLKTAAAGSVALFGHKEASADSSELESPFEFSLSGNNFSSEFLGFPFSTTIKREWVTADSPQGITAVVTNPPTWISTDSSLSDQSHEFIKKIVFNAQTTPSKYSTQSEVYAVTPQEGQASKEYSASVLSHIVKNGGEIVYDLPRTLDKAHCEGNEISANVPGNNPEEPYFNFMGTYFEHDGKIVCITMQTTLDQYFYYDNVNSYWELLSSFELPSNSLSS